MTSVPRTITAALIALFALGADPSPGAGVFSRDNLVAWCIVPFDAKKRSPEQRAEMLQRIGIKHFAYDWRDEHLPTFDAEIDALQRHDIELTAVWFPAQLNQDAQTILAALEKHKLAPQLWVTTDVPDNRDQDGNRIIVDVKSAATAKNPCYRLKRKLVEVIHGITVTEVMA